jgi:hypothetical protein
MPAYDDKPLVDRLLEHDRVVIEASLSWRPPSATSSDDGVPGIGACVFVDEGRTPALSFRFCGESVQALAEPARRRFLHALRATSWERGLRRAVAVPARLLMLGGGVLGRTSRCHIGSPSSYVLHEGIARQLNQAPGRVCATARGSGEPMESGGRSRSGASKSRGVRTRSRASFRHPFMQWSAVGLAPARLPRRMERRCWAWQRTSTAAGGSRWMRSSRSRPSSVMGNKGQSIAHKARRVPTDQRNVRDRRHG